MNNRSSGFNPLQNFEYKKAWDLVDRSEKITLLTHSRPDGDAVAACVALELVLVKLGKTVETVYPDKPEFEFTLQPQNVLIGEHNQTPDLIIASDAANYDRLYFPDEYTDVPIINIDHHVSNSLDATIDFVDPESSSACEVLYNILLQWAPELIDDEVASALLFGILYDSRVFHTQSTKVTTLRVAAELMEKGADLFKLKCELLSNKDPKIARLWSKILDRIQVSSGGNAAWSYVEQKDLKDLGLTLQSLLGFNDFLSDMIGIDITLFFYETDDGKTKVSLRSKVADVNQLASLFGGGGHKNASGIMSDVPLKKFVKQVVEAIP